MPAGNYSGNSNTVSVTTRCPLAQARSLPTILRPVLMAGLTQEVIVSGPAMEAWLTKEPDVCKYETNSSTSHSESPVLDLTGNTQVELELHVLPRSMETGEDFFVEFFDGSSYQVIGQYVSGTDFTNNVFFSPPLIVITSGFATNNRFRIRCDASNNNDKIYFDQVIVTGDNAPLLAPEQPVVTEDNNTLLLSLCRANQ